LYKIALSVSKWNMVPKTHEVVYFICWIPNMQNTTSENNNYWGANSQDCMWNDIIESHKQLPRNCYLL